MPAVRAAARILRLGSAREAESVHELGLLGKPVPGFGDLRAGIWIVGAPAAAHGANRTGRIFHGGSERGFFCLRRLHRAWDGESAGVNSSGRWACAAGDLHQRGGVAAPPGE